jgi:hypothetical protein
MALAIQPAIDNDPLLDLSRERTPVWTNADLGLFTLLVDTGKNLPTWWTPARDRALRKLWMSSDFLSGAIYSMVAKMASIPLVISPRDPSVRKHVEEAKTYANLLNNLSQGGQGWRMAYELWLQDYFSQDNGGFFEILGPGDPAGMITGQRFGVRHLEAGRCIRTSSLEYPVVYRREDGKLFKLHISRVMFKASLPSTLRTMNNVGFCAISRAATTAQYLNDITNYKLEKMGSRPTRAIVTIEGMNQQQALEAFKVAELQQRSEGLSHYSKFVLLSSPDPIKVNKVDLASIPDGYNEEESIRNAIYTIALAFGVDPRELWAAVSAGATKADAALSHIKSRGKGPAEVIRSVEWMLNACYLPPHLKAEFDYQDDEEDALSSKIQFNRSQQVRNDLQTGVIDIRTARIKLTESGVYSKEVFETLELQDGRLEDGADVLLLFNSNDPKLRAMLDVGVPKPLRVEQNDAALVLENLQLRLEEALADAYNADSDRVKRQARQVIAALEKLRALYTMPPPPSPDPKANPAGNQHRFRPPATRPERLMGVTTETQLPSSLRTATALTSEN